MSKRLRGCALVVLFLARAGAGAAAPGPTLTREEIEAEFRKASTGNVADAVDEATGPRGFMHPDMRPIFRANIIGAAATALLRPLLKSHAPPYPNYAVP